MLPDPRTTPFNICFIDNNTKYKRAVDDWIAQLGNSLTDLGYSCSINEDFAVAGAVNILVGYHRSPETFQSNAGPRLPIGDLIAT